MDYIIKDWFFIKKIEAKNIYESDYLDRDDLEYIKSLKPKMDYLWRRVNQRYKRNLPLHIKIIKEWRENALDVTLKNIQENLKK